VNYEEITFEAMGLGVWPWWLRLQRITGTGRSAKFVMRFQRTAEPGCVGFGEVPVHEEGLIAVEKDAATEEQLLDIVLEHGGEDLNDEGDTWEMITDPAAHEAVAAR